jgi:hypothetical protein
LTHFANNETDAITESWRELNQDSRIAKMSEVIKDTQFSELFRFTRALDSGAVYVSMEQPIGPSTRGATLLNFEEFLKIKVDKGINVWCEPIGDRNSLRNLRGVQIIN